MAKSLAFPTGRTKRFWITEKQRMTQARKSWQTLIDIRDGRVQEQKWDDVAGKMVSVAASVKEVREASTKIMAYAVGMPTQSVEVGGENGGPISISWEK